MSQARRIGRIEIDEHEHVTLMDRQVLVFQKDLALLVLPVKYEQKNVRNEHTHTKIGKKSQVIVRFQMLKFTP